MDYISCNCSSDVSENDGSSDCKYIQDDCKCNEEEMEKGYEEMGEGYEEEMKPTKNYEEIELTHEQRRLENQIFIREKSLLASSKLAERYIRNEKCKHETKNLLQINKVLSHKKQTSRSNVLKKMSFLVSDKITDLNIQRFHTLLSSFMSFNMTEEFNLDELQYVIVMMEYLANHIKENKTYRMCFLQMINQCGTPMLTEGSAHTDHYFKDLISLFDLMGYLLVAVEDECCFDSLFNSVLRLLFFNENCRKKTAIKSEYCIKAVENSVIIETVVQMVAICSSNRYNKYIELAAAFASLSSYIRNTMVSQNIIENIFYRLNPYFLYSNKVKPDVGLHDPNDTKVLLGDAEVHLNTTLTLLVTLLWETQVTLNEKPYFKDCLKPINEDALRSFEWAFRLECSKNDRKHQRLIMSTVVVGLLDCYGSRVSFCKQFMEDLMILAVQTEVPVTCPVNWISKVKWNTSKLDVGFKKSLILCGLLCIKHFPHNNILMDKTNFSQGLIFIIDPNLATLYRWTDALFTELRIFSMKVLVYLVKFNRENILKKYNIIKRTLCLLDCHNVKQLDLNTVYWNVRILESLIDQTNTSRRKVFEEKFQNLQGDLVLINLCKTLITNNKMNGEQRDVIVAHLLGILNSCLNLQAVKSDFEEEPNIVYDLAISVLHFVTAQINLNYNVSNRLLVSLINIIWDTVTRNQNLLNLFICENGIYTILDLIDVLCPSVQCIGLALLADLAYDERVILHMYSWRGRSKVHIKKLLAQILRDDCIESDIKLDMKTNVIQDLEYPLMSSRKRKAFEELKTTDPVFTEKYSGLSSITVMDVAGSRMSKVHAILCILQEGEHVILDKHSMEDDMTLDENIILKLAEYYRLCKLGEVWKETQILFEYLNMKLLPTDAILLNDIYELYRQLPIKIKREQESILNKQEKKNIAKEQAFYKCLKSVNIMKAWDALCDIKDQALTSDMNQRKQWMQSQIVEEENQLKCMKKKIGCEIIRTLKPNKVLLRDENVTVQSMSFEDPRGEIQSSK